MNDQQSGILPIENLRISSGDPTIKLHEPNSSITVFSKDKTEILRITQDGFVYKGEVINDAGDAHRAFIDAMGILCGGKPAINTHRRLFDLVRYMRDDLSYEGLITDEEYAWLSGHLFPEDKNKPGSPSPRRLEDYDRLRAELDTANALLRQSVVALTFPGDQGSATTQALRDDIVHHLKDRRK